LVHPGDFTDGAVGRLLKNSSRAGKSVTCVSLGQERLLSIYHLHPDYRHHTDLLLRLTGAIDVEALRWGLGEIASRHQALRTTFGFSGGTAWQRIWPTTTVPFELVQAADVAAPDGTGELSLDAVLRAAGDFVREAFDLRRGPLLRARLIRVADHEAALQIVIHHIVSDGWSLTVLLDELSALYAGRIERSGSRLEPLAVHYADYAAWQRQQLTGEHLERLVRYWRSQLDGAPQVIHLPTDKPRPASRSFLGTTANQLLPAQTATRLAELAGTEGATLFMVLLAVACCLLSRWSEQSDLLIATTVANRTRREFEALIGFFVNTLIMRIDLAGRPDFRTVLRRVRETVLSGLDHQDTPFDQVVNALQPDRDLSRQPLAQVLFTMQNFGPDMPQFPGLTVQRLVIPERSTQYDLVLSADEEPGGLRLSVTCSSDLFADGTCERFLAGLCTLADDVAWRPDAPIALLAVLPAGERRLMVDRWNATTAPYPAGQCLHELVEAQVRRSPAALAVVSEAGRLTYAELDERASRLAERLRQLGAGPERIVATFLPRSPDLAVAVLGILKAGAAWVILDPDYPAERLAFILADSRATVVISDRSLRDRVPGSAAPVLLADSWTAAAADCAATDCAATRGPAVTDDNLAYIIYTSGSTGAPKAVAVTHRGICNLVSWMARAHQWDSGTVLAHLVSISFDAAVRDLFVPLASGGRVVLPSADEMRDRKRLIDLLERHGVNVVHGVPSLIQALLGDGDDRPRGIQRICCGGEALPVSLLERCRARGIALVNLYGPAEATVDATSFACADVGEGTTVPIGHPISNAGVYVLDQEFQPVPVGVAGEIFIGGLGVARGYLGHPALTAQRFLPHPFASRPGERMYRTGDRARWLPEGRLEFLGRLDYQVKIRGFRVEPGEIEAVLGQHRQVRECAVIAQEPPGQPAAGGRLVAYLVPEGPELPSSSQLRAFLSNRLPHYLIPAVFVPVSGFPLTANGKLDRAALPPPPAQRPELDSSYTAPRTPTARVLAGIWAGLLGLDKAGINDDFFELGGHSLLAMRMAMKISSVYNLTLSPTLPFRCRTINDIEEALRELVSEEELNQAAARYAELKASPDTSEW
jgi:amino acid adenylation domain-containing protein